MEHNRIPDSIIKTVVSGTSSLDVPQIDCRTPEQAARFLSAYGLGIETDDDLRKLMLLYRRALIYLEEVILTPDEKIPKTLSQISNVDGILSLLVLASEKHRFRRPLQRWACAILRVAHVLMQLDHDLFSLHRLEIQDQVLQPFRSRIRIIPGSEELEFVSDSGEKVLLHRFEAKPDKTSQSSITKLLAKRSTLAMNLLDRVGVRFVTSSKYDIFRTLEILIQDHLISFPHIVPNQSKNTVFPIQDIQAEILKSRYLGLSTGEIESRINQIAHRSAKSNDFSDENYKFLKFICRKLITVGSSRLSFFYPFEIQIMDRESYKGTLVGPGAHRAYKSRQIQAARRRLFGNMASSLQKLGEES